MKRTVRLGPTWRLSCLAVVSTLLSFAVFPQGITARTPPAEPPAFATLLFSKTAGFRHDSIPDGIRAVERLGRENGFRVDATEDASVFTEQGLGTYRVVIFLNTTQDILDSGQQAAFERFIASGGGFVGVHAAADTEYDWPWYGRLVGAYFKSHPQIQQAVLRVLDRDHLSTRQLPSEWTRIDEWYNYRQPPSGVRILVELDESSYTGGTMGSHPIAWSHENLGGRAWYTGLGHTKESYSEPLFLKHLLGGILWASGDVAEK